uniref:Uncharacterized protein n=1 Tax=Anguilla anguilla TaxID=7936 RepID=A0A0E9WLL6_ANGAN
MHKAFSPSVKNKKYLNSSLSSNKKNSHSFNIKHCQYLQTVSNTTLGSFKLRPSTPALILLGGLTAEVHRSRLHGLKGQSYASTGSLLNLIVAKHILQACVSRLHF